jgi:hypothetical protein
VDDEINMRGLGRENNNWQAGERHQCSTRRDMPGHNQHEALTAKCASSKVLQWLCNDHIMQVVHTRNSTSSLPPAALRARSMTANPTPFSSIHSNKIIDTPSDSTCSAEGVKFDAGVEDGSESK